MGKYYFLTNDSKIKHAKKKIFQHIKNNYIQCSVNDATMIQHCQIWGRKISTIGWEIILIEKNACKQKHSQCVHLTA